MKYILTITLFFFSSLLASAQDGLTGTLFQSKSKTHLYYVHVDNTVAYVYRMGTYLDKAGTGNAIMNADTLARQADGSYAGRSSKLILDDDKFYVVTEFRKGKKYSLDTVKQTAIANSNLNNAYYLPNYFKMTDTLNKYYPLTHHSFRGGYFSWKTLPNKEINYIQFRDFADKYLEDFKDSVSNRHDGYTALTNYIVQNLGKLDYTTLKDSLIKLPAENSYYLSGYYTIAINEIAKQQPGYFLRLAEDLPELRSAIFYVLDRKKAVMEGLKAAEGHDAIKKELFKSKKA